MTRSTGDRPSRAILEAAHGSPKTVLASRLTESVVAMSTSIGRLVPAQIRLTSSNACRADGPVIFTPRGQVNTSRPSSSMIKDSYSLGSDGVLTGGLLTRIMQVELAGSPE
jgi:hypothetical protein